MDEELRVHLLELRAAMLELRASQAERRAALANMSAEISALRIQISEGLQEVVQRLDGIAAYLVEQEDPGHLEDLAAQDEPDYPPTT